MKEIVSRMITCWNMVYTCSHPYQGESLQTGVSLHRVNS